MGDQRIFVKTAKGRVKQRHAQAEMTPALLEVLRVIDGITSIDTLTKSLAGMEGAKFLSGIQTLEQMGLIQVASAEGDDPPSPLLAMRPQPLDKMVEVMELDPQESVMAWAAANRGAKELQENGFFSNSSRTEQGRHAMPGRSLRALVVDDDPIILDLITVALEEHGYIVTVAQTAARAASILKKMDLPDLVLLDVQMPGHDGFELLALIRATPKFANLPVIMVTGQTGDEHVLKGLQYGADGYIFKPFKWEKLFDCTRSVLRTQ